MATLQATASLPTAYGLFTIHAYECSGQEHLALVKNSIQGKEKVLVRIHSQCLTGDVFGSKRCDCGQQLAKALQQIAEEGTGILLYLRQEGRGIGLVNKIKAYALQDRGMDTVEANVHLGFEPDERDYRVAVEILKDLGVKSVRLLTNNPHKIKDLKLHGLKIVERVPLVTVPTKQNRSYLRTKKKKLGHWLE